MPDGPENDYFATQFATSIVQESGGGAKTNYWFGRMLRFLGSSEYVFRNFFGTDYTEKEFRAKYQNGEIAVNRFDISNVVYTIDPADATLAVVTMNVYIEAVLDNQAESGNFTLAHKVKRGWQAYDSQLTAA